MYANKFKLSVIVLVLLVIYPSPFHASTQGEGGSPKVGDCIGENTAACQEEGTTINGQSQLTDLQTPGVTIWEFVKMIFALLFVLALIYGALKIINKKNKRFDSGRSVENIGGTNLGNNKSLQLIKVGNSILVVGVGDSINLLKEINDQEEIDALQKTYKERADASVVSPEAFKGLLNRFQASNKKSQDFSSLLKEQIGQLSLDRKKKMKELDDEEGFKK